ncbi:sialate O-acetylesterase [Telluribacter humicola]|uniref:sialate O-acetylesterase n=1 Tax=Telluribacter humicola TaxID=1720261 RepID=UPI001A959B78|nr:sialate O-acetylesterase [Telluribacter humicola]
MRFLYGILYLLISIPLVGYAQVTVTFPTSRAVFQRDNFNKTTVNIGGYYSDCVDRVEARFVPRVAGQGVEAPLGGGWQAIHHTPSGGQFYGSMVVRGGWYELQVRAIRDEAVVGQDVVDRVGVGEVFLVAGQSNASGGDGLPSGPGAADDRVNSVDFQNLSQQGPISYANTQLPCPVFVHLDQETKTAPFGSYAWCWGAFGDRLVSKLNVPVMIFNAGWSGTGIRNWRESIDTQFSSVSFFGYPYPPGMPFGHLRLALNYYIAQQGYRAVLWHQGESDNYEQRSREDYRHDLRQLILNSRSLSGKPDLAWVVARASRFTVDGTSRIWPPVIDAQNDVIGLNSSDAAVALAHVFPGPETDPMVGSAYRTSDEIHFTSTVQIALAQAWVDQLPAAFFTGGSTPYLPTPPPSLLASCGGDNALSFSAPSGWTSYQWYAEADCNQVLNDQPQWTGTTGTYRLKAKDALHNTVFSPRVRVPASTATTVSTNGDRTVAAGGSIVLEVVATNGCNFNWSGPQSFSSTSRNVTIPNATTARAGTYQVKVTNSYGCQAQTALNVSVIASVETIASGNWNSTTTWSCGCVPGIDTEVVLNAGHTITVDGVLTHAKMLRLNGGQLEVKNGGNVQFNQ